MLATRTAFVGVVLLVSLTAFALQRQTGQRVRDVAITHVNVIDTIAGTTMPDMTVFIRGDRIVSVEKAGAGDPRQSEIVNGRNKFLIPGLWDMHVHLSYARVSALASLVANGVLYARDMGSDLAELDRWRSQIADNVLVGPTVFRAGPILNGMEFNTYQLAVTNEAEGRMTVRALKKTGVDFIKVHRRTSRDAYFGIVNEAKMLGLPVTGHVPVTVSPAEASDAGQASLEHTETLFEGTFATEHAGQDLNAETARWRETGSSALFNTLVRNGTAVDPTLSALAGLAQLLEAAKPDPRIRYVAVSARQEAEKSLGAVRPNAARVLIELKPRIRELQAVTGALHRAGVKLLSGTDLSFLAVPGFSLHDELELLTAAGLSPAEALRTATVNPSGLFPAHNAGSIAPGRRADLVLLDANPLTDITNTQRINAVVLRGTPMNRKSLDQLLSDAAKLAAIN
jgi:imidazolonepropionase-like amidohydrolase